MNDQHEIFNIHREQLENVKSINLDLVNEGQKNDIELKRLDKELEELKENLNQAMTRTFDLEKKLESLIRYN